MKRFIVFLTVLLIAVCGVFIAFAPDILSLIVVSVMFLFMLLGNSLGVIPNLLFAGGFKNGRASVDSVRKIAADNKWAAIRQIHPFFKQKTLDDIFTIYLEKTKSQMDSGLILSDIEDFINEDSMELRNWHGVVLQISGILTALGLLGTFLGLMTGISSVAFSTLDATIASIETLLSGITTAFYTSIVGVILSIIFNLTNRVVWNLTVREMRLFIESFHAEIQPDAEEQLHAKGYLQNEEIIRLLTQMNNTEGRGSAKLVKDTSYEQRLMVQVLSGVENGEFSTVYEPVCKLEDRSVIKTVARLRWTHPSLGVVHNSVYFPVIESNGYLIKFERKLWRDAAQSLSNAKKNGQRTVPVVLYVSKIFLMSADLAKEMADLIGEFDLTPRDFELSFPLEVYLTCHSEAFKTEQALLKMGYKVSIHGFSGSMVDLPQTNAEELVLDMNQTTSKLIRNAFSGSQKKNLTISAEHVVSAKQLAEIRKFGCEYGKGRHLYPEMTLSEFTALIDGETL